MENDRIIKKQRISIRYSDEFKKTVVREVLDGLSKDGASRKYGIGGHTTVLRWIRQYENLPMIEPVQENQPRHLEKSFKYIESENRRLRKERELIKLKVRELNVMIDTAKAKTEVPNRKIFQPGSFENSNEIGKKVSFISLRHLSTQLKSFTNKIKEFVDR